MNERRVALVTGAGRGIGGAIASRLSRDGLFVVGTATAAEGVDRIRALLGGNGVLYQMTSELRVSVERGFGHLEVKFERELGGVRQRLGRIETRLDGIESRLNDVEGRLRRQAAQGGSAR